jgi:hypothetical protein
MVLNSITGKFLIGLPIFVFAATLSWGQSKEIGGGVVGSFYTGDMSRTLELGELRPGGQLFYRRNYSEHLGVRYNLAISAVSGSDENPIDAFADLRDQSFSIAVIEGAALVEYNFLDYRENLNQFNWSPYAFAGLGVMTLTGEESNPNDFSKVQPVIPMGIGFKYLLDWKWTFSAEFGARKTFFDYLDNVGEGDLAVKNYQYGNQNLNDWYYFIGISLSYTFHIVPCPFEDYN